MLPFLHADISLRGDVIIPNILLWNINWNDKEDETSPVILWIVRTRTRDVHVAVWEYSQTRMEFHGSHPAKQVPANIILLFLQCTCVCLLLCLVVIIEVQLGTKVCFFTVPRPVGVCYMAGSDLWFIIEMLKHWPQTHTHIHTHIYIYIYIYILTKNSQWC